ncbi:MAG: hypothetical protein WAW52_07790 [Methanothrix sp.]
MKALETRLCKLESSLHCGQIKTTGDDGREVWIKGSGLKFMRTVLKAGRGLGKDAKLEALPKDLQRDVGLWSRADLPVCGLSDMAKEICRGLVDEAG